MFQTHKAMTNKIQFCVIFHYNNKKTKHSFAAIKFLKIAKMFEISDYFGNTIQHQK